MRYLIFLLFASFLFSACATTTKAADAVSKVSNNNSSLSKYLRDYLSQNLEDRAKSSRGLIDRSAIESNGRLPSTSLFQSLGYRMRDAFVAIPPELNTRNFKDVESDLYPKLIHDLERTWALLDTTRARLKSQGGLETGRQDWEVSVSRRNLILEAVSYWYQLRNQEDHSQWLLRLGDRSNELYEEISNARQNYDVKDLRDHEFLLLNLRADVATLFQFFSSEQARIYNRIGERVLPQRRDDEQPKFGQQLQCQANQTLNEKGTAYLTRYYQQRLAAIRGSNYKTSTYELNELAREVSSQALEIHSSRLNAIEQDYIAARSKAQKKRESEIELLEKRQRALIEIGQITDAEKLEALKNAPLGVSRANDKASEAEELLYSAITVLADIAAEKLLEVNQARLKRVLVSANEIYQGGRSKIWQGATDETRVLYNLLLDIYDFNLADYLLGYERLTFINKAMMHGCDISQKINSRVIGFDPQSIDEISILVEKQYANDISIKSFEKKSEKYIALSNAFSSSVVGQGYKVGGFTDLGTGETVSGFEFNSQGGQATLVSAKQHEYDRINKRFAEQGLALASKEDVLVFTQGRGYSLMLAETESLLIASDLMKRYATGGKAIVYRSQEPSTKRVLLKVLVGQEKDYDDILNYQKELKQGVIKSFSEVRNEIYDE